MSKEVAYARVSSQSQQLSRQLEMLKTYVSEEMIVTDKASGKDLNRAGYQSLKVGIGKLVAGDTLYITSLDRLSRNKEDAKQELQYFASIGVRVKILDIPTTMIDIADGQEWILNMINNILIEVLASVSENERHNIRTRQKQGLDVMPIDPVTGKKKSTKTGNVIGRPEIQFPTNWNSIYPLWKSGSITAVQAMQKMNLKKNSFYKLVKRYEET